MYDVERSLYCSLLARVFLVVQGLQQIIAQLQCDCSVRDVPRYAEEIVGRALVDIYVTMVLYYYCPCDTRRPTP